MKYSMYNLETTDETTGRIVLFNTLTGHSFFVTQDIVDAIRCNNISVLDKATLNLFKRCGIVVEDSVDEKRYVAYYHNKVKFASDSLSSTVLLTWACNFSCVYCYEGAGAKTEMMSPDGAAGFIKFMINEAETRRIRYMHITLFGGEPLINIQIGIQILEQLKDYCDHKNIYFSCGIITNGTLFTEDIITSLIKYNCVTAQVTLDGIKETHDHRRPYKGGRGSFDDVISAIKSLANYPKIKTVIRINIDRSNLAETESLLAYIGKNGLDLTGCSVDFGIVRSSTKACSSYSGNCISEDELGDTLSQLWSIAENEGFHIYTRPSQRWVYCGLFNDGQFTITPDCSVYKCWEHAGLEEHKMGEIDSEGRMINIAYPFFDWMTRNPIDDKDCADCVYLPACGGGCGVVSFNETSSYHHKGCFKVKGVLEKQIQRFVKDATEIVASTN